MGRVQDQQRGQALAERFVEVMHAVGITGVSEPEGSFERFFDGHTRPLSLITFSKSGMRQFAIRCNVPDDATSPLAMLRKVLAVQINKVVGPPSEDDNLHEDVRLAFNDGQVGLFIDVFGMPLWEDGDPRQHAGSQRPPRGPLPQEERMLARALQGSVLATREPARRTLPDSSQIVLIVDGSGEDVLTAWRAARAVLDVTGRYPIAVDANVLEIDEEIPFVANSPWAVLERSRSVQADSVFARRRARWPTEAGDVAGELRLCQQLSGAAPAADEVTAALGVAPSRPALDRWLLDWEAARQGDVLARPVSANYLDWFAVERFAIAFLPTPDPWAVAAFTDFFAFWGPGGEEDLVAVLREWHGRFQAEPVANWGTMMQFVVGRPPADLHDAWELAEQQDQVAGGTIGAAGVALRYHALNLIGRPDWFLHERP